MTSPQFEKPISDLRRPMLQDMTNRNFGDKTKHDYIRQVEALAKFLDRSPDTATADDVRQFQADQIGGGAQPPKMNSQGFRRSGLLQSSPCIRTPASAPVGLAWLFLFVALISVFRRKRLSDRMVQVRGGEFRFSASLGRATRRIVKRILDFVNSVGGQPRERQPAGSPPGPHLLLCRVGSLFLQSIILAHVYRARGEREAGSGLCDHIIGSQQDILADCVEIIPLPRPGIHPNCYIER